MTYCHDGFCGAFDCERCHPASPVYLAEHGGEWFASFKPDGPAEPTRFDSIQDAICWAIDNDLKPIYE